MIYLKWRKGKTYSQKYSTKQGASFRFNRGIKRQAKAQRIQQDPTSFTIKTNGTAPGRNKKKDQWNTVGSPEIDPCTYGAPHLYPRR